MDDETSRTPHGVRGLKFFGVCEMVDSYGRTPHGVRGLKWHVTNLRATASSRTPHGVRGLKSLGTVTFHQSRQVAPLTGCVD